MKTNLLISLLVFGILALVIVLPIAEARSFSNFRWDIDETYHRDGHVQFAVQKGSENFLPIGVKGLNNVTVTLHPTINHDQTGEAKLPRGVDIYFEPDMVTLTDGEIKTVKLVINVDENAPANLYDVQIVGTWKEENNSSGFMGSAIRLHVGHDFGDGKIPVNMLHPPLKFWKYIKNEEGITVNDVPCRNDYVLIVKHDGTPACVTESTKQKLIERGWATTYPDTYDTKTVFEIVKDEKIFDVEYKIKGGSVEDMVYDKDGNTLLTTIDSSGEGKFTVVIPRDLLDAKMDYCPPLKANPPDGRFFVLLDGKEIPYDEILTTSEKRTLQIPFTDDAILEIIGACLI
jgi:hypothetical protein